MKRFYPSLIINNGRFWTMRDGAPPAEAVAIFGRIVAVGATRRLRLWQVQTPR